MKTVTCKKCGQTGLVWQKSRKGSYYLTNSARRNDFHSKTCKPKKRESAMERAARIANNMSPRIAERRAARHEREDPGNRAERELLEQEIYWEEQLAAAERSEGY